MEVRGVHRKLTAILSADVVGYSRLMAEDDVGTVRMLTEHRALLKIVIEGYRGRVVDSPGDNVLAEFPSVVDAVECGVVIQKELKAQNDRLPANRQMQFRIGINLGDVIVDGERIYGDGVNIAARLESLADAGGICISGSAYDQIENKLPLGYESLGAQVVKNFAKPVRVYRAITATEPAVYARDVEPEPVPVAQAPSRAPASTREGFASSARRRAALVAAVLVTLGAVGGIAASRLATPTATTAAVPPVLPKPSLAVLPFLNATGHTGRDEFAAQLEAAVRAELSRLSGVTMPPATAVQAYRSPAVSAAQAGRELDVRFVLDGRIETVDGRPRLLASLIDVTTGQALWSERFERPLTSVAAIQHDLLQQLIATMPIALTAEEHTARAIPRADIPAKPASATVAPAKARETATVAPAERRPRTDGAARSADARPATSARPGTGRGDDTARVTTAPAARPEPSRASQAMPPSWASPRERDVQGP